MAYQCRCDAQLTKRDSAVLRVSSLVFVELVVKALTPTSGKQTKIPQLLAG